MKKETKIIIIIAVVLLVVLILVIMYMVDMNRMQSNKPVVFSTWGHKYAPPESTGNDENIKDKTEKNSFVATVLEETTTYMVVEPNEDEEIRKSADRIVINYGEDHEDYLYGVGRKVKITYSGQIMETYPAKINTRDISVVE